MRDRQHRRSGRGRGDRDAAPRGGRVRGSRGALPARSAAHDEQQPARAGLLPEAWIPARRPRSRRDRRGAEAQAVDLGGRLGGPSDPGRAPPRAGHSNSARQPRQNPGYSDRLEDWGRERVERRLSVVAATLLARWREDLRALGPVGDRGCRRAQRRFGLCAREPAVRREGCAEGSPEGGSAPQGPPAPREAREAPQGRSRPSRPPRQPAAIRVAGDLTGAIAALRGSRARARPLREQLPRRGRDGAARRALARADRGRGARQRLQREHPRRHRLPRERRLLGRDRRLRPGRGLGAHADRRGDRRRLPAHAGRPPPQPQADLPDQPRARAGKGGQGRSPGRDPPQRRPALRPRGVGQGDGPLPDRRARLSRPRRPCGCLVPHGHRQPPGRDRPLGRRAAERLDGKDRPGRPALLREALLHVVTRPPSARLGAPEHAQRRHAQLLLEGARRRADHVAVPPQPAGAPGRRVAAGAEELGRGSAPSEDADVALRPAEGHRPRRAPPRAAAAPGLLAQDASSRSRRSSARWRTECATTAGSTARCGRGL